MALSSVPGEVALVYDTQTLAKIIARVVGIVPNRVFDPYLRKSQRLSFIAASGVDDLEHVTA